MLGWFKKKFTKEDKPEETAVDEAEVIEEKREPLPSWAVERLRQMTGRNWKQVRDELVEEGAAQ